MESKICNECFEEKQISEFAVRNKKTQNTHNRCKQCTNIYAKEYRIENKETIKEKQEKWYSTVGKEWKKTYEKENRDKINEVCRNRYKTDKNYRMKKILRSRFKSTVSKKKIYKSVINYVGIDLDLLIKWIEFQFDSNMNWQNQGKYWDIDHVIPCKEFDLTNEDEIKKCFHWTNMRPMERIANYIKNDKVIDSVIDEQKLIVLKFKSYISSTKS